MTLVIDQQASSGTSERHWKLAMARGALSRCPSCAKGGLYDRYLKVVDRCPACGEELHHHRADDAPPYFTMTIIGHVVVPLVLVVERLWAPPLAFHFLVWTAVTLALAFALMPAVKGAIVGLQWALRMHGFESAAQDQTP